MGDNADFRQFPRTDSRPLAAGAGPLLYRVLSAGRSLRLPAANPLILNLLQDKRISSRQRQGIGTAGNYSGK